MSEKTQNNSKTDAMKTYNYADAVEVAKRYFKGDDLAATVWVSKYALKDSMGNLYEESPEQMHRRIADEIERIERRYPNPMTAAQVYDLLKEFRYLIPQGGPMTGIGNNLQIASLSNCFVIGHRHPADSYGGIIRIDEEQVQLMKRRGGVGHDLSHIRPTGSPVLNSALTSTGIVPFMERYSNSTREVAQDGRRGALMLSLSVKHPDAENFIDAKVETGKVTGANVSIKIDDEFMHAVIDGKKYHQQFPIDSDKPMYEKDIDARALWNKIVFNAWKSAEPGVLFWDTILRESVPDCYADLGFRTVSTNPCGEIPLCPYDSCRLLAINLYSYVDKPFTKEASFNFDKFRRPRRRSHADDGRYHRPRTRKGRSDPRKNLERSRRRGYPPGGSETVGENPRKSASGTPYGPGHHGRRRYAGSLGPALRNRRSDRFRRRNTKNAGVEAYRTSVKMAQERGKFPIYDAGREEGNPMIERIKEADPALYEEMVKHGRRNIAMLTIAPTGTTSLMSQTTSGIEPVFRPVYTRRRKVNPGDQDVKVTFVDEVGDSWEEYNVFHHKFLVWLEVNGYDIEEVKNMPMTEIDKLVALSPYYKATANDIDWVSKVKMQGAIQKWVDHSISVTVNLPNEVTKELVAKVYLTAWEYGCKGVTVYRDGSRAGVLVDKKKKKGAKTEEAPVNPDGYRPPLKRPLELSADIVRFKNGEEDWISFVGIYNDRPYEIFTGKIEEDAMFIPQKIKKGVIIKVKDAEGNKRYDFQYKDKYGYTNTIGGISRLFDEEFWNYAKLISGVLRNGMPILDVVTLIESLHLNSESINTWKNGVARALKQYIANGTKAKEKCPNCGQETLVYQNSCPVCMSCGYSKCG